MGGFGSGGANRKSVATHILTGSFKPSRHEAYARMAASKPSPLSANDRREVLYKLSPAARKLASSLLNEFDGWDAAKLTTLRTYALACARLAELEAAPPADSRALHREIRAVIALRKSLGLERLL